jgi:hypothetical protein
MIRILAPDGSLGMVPEDQAQSAIEAGGRVMTPELMREMRQAVFMEHAIFNDQRKPVKREWKHRLVRSGRR